MTIHELAYKLWEFLGPGRSPEDDWFLAEDILRGNRPNWLFAPYLNLTTIHRPTFSINEKGQP